MDTKHTHLTVFSPCTILGSLKMQQDVHFTFIMQSHLCNYWGGGGRRVIYTHSEVLKKNKKKNPKLKYN